MAAAAPCLIYLIVEPGASSRDRLAAALEAAPVASVLIRGRDGAPLVATEAKPLVDLAQSKGVAALIADDARLARTLRADGVHLSPRATLIDDFATAREPPDQAVEQRRLVADRPSFTTIA